MYDAKPDEGRPTPIELAAIFARGDDTESDRAWAAQTIRDLLDALKLWKNYDDLADVSPKLQSLPDGERLRHEARIRTAYLTLPPSV